MEENNPVEVARQCTSSNGLCIGCSHDKIAACKSILLGLLVEEIDKRDKRIEELEKRVAIMGEGNNAAWIPVEVMKPRSMINKVLVYCQHEDLVPQIGYGHFEKYKGVEMWYDLETGKQFSEHGYFVTHWMPLPKAPKGKETGNDKT